MSDTTNPIFIKFVRNCVDITRDNSATLDEIAEFAVGCFRPEELAGLKIALSEVLKKNDISLDELWKHLGARVGLSPSPRSLIKLAHARVEEQLAGHRENR